MYIEKLSFTPNGLEMFYWEKREKKRGVIALGNGLHDPCEIEAGTTIRHILEYIRSTSSHESFMSTYMCSRSIKKWHKQLDDKSREIETDNIKEMVILWSNENMKEPYGNCFSTVSQLFGKNEKSDKYLVDGGPLKNFIDLPLSLDENFNVFEYGDGMEDNGELKFSEYIGLEELDEDYTPSPKVYNFCPKQFTVLEILKAIYTAILAYGSPEEAKKTLDEIRKRVQDALAHPEKGIPAEEVFARLREKFKDA